MATIVNGPPASFVVPVALGAQVTVSMLQQGLPSISTPIQAQLHVGLTGLGLLLGAANAATAATVYAWGWWSDRAGDRRVLLTGLPLAATALAGAGCAAAGRASVLVVVGLVLAGAGMAAGTAALARALADRTPPARLGVVLGLRQAAVPVGGLLGAAVLPLAAGLAGPGAAFAVLALACAAATIAIALGLPASPAHPRSRPSTAEEIEAVRLPLHGSPRASPAAGRRGQAEGRTQGLAALFAANACYCVAQTGTVALSVVAWHNAIGISAAAAVALFTTVQVGSGLLRIALGQAGDRRPEREPMILIGLGAAAATLLGALACAHTLALPAAVQAGLLLVACLPAAGWNGLAFAASTRLVIVHQARFRLGRIHGRQNTVIFVAVGLTPPMMTAIVARTGWATAWWVLGACAAAGALIHLTSPSRQSISRCPTSPEAASCTSSAPTISS